MSARTFRARFHAGQVELLEALSLPEGTEVTVLVEEPRRGSPKAIVAAMDRWSKIDPAAFEELEQAIEAGKIPMSSEGIFDKVKD